MTKGETQGKCSMATGGGTTPPSISEAQEDQRDGPPQSPRWSGWGDEPETDEIENLDSWSGWGDQEPNENILSWANYQPPSTLSQTESVHPSWNSHQWTGSTQADSWTSNDRAGRGQQSNLTSCLFHQIFSNHLLPLPAEQLDIMPFPSDFFKSLASLVHQIHGPAMIVLDEIHGPAMIVLDEAGATSVRIKVRTALVAAETSVVGTLAKSGTAKWLRARGYAKKLHCPRLTHRG
eukprot:symbB.v1.2.037726.t1/scaffold5649.1/size36637/1